MTLIGFFTMLPSILWPLALVAIAYIAYRGLCHWLVRESATVVELRANIQELEKDWAHKFAASEENHDRRISAIERRMNQEGTRSPLGSHYDTRRGA